MTHSAFRFTDAICRKPSASVVDGLRAGTGRDPDPALFLTQHGHYLTALQNAGVQLTVLDALDDFPDAVFVEDAALCFTPVAVVCRPGAPTRFGEAAAMTPHLHRFFPRVAELAAGRLEGGDVLVTGREVLVGLSDRSDREGVDALAAALAPHGLPVRAVQTPADTLHFKSDCAVLGEDVVFSTASLASSGCFDGYEVVEVPAGEEAAANLIRVNDTVIMRTGFPESQRLLTERGTVDGFEVVAIDTGEAALIDGGLSCLSLRFARDLR